jgi:hypothetical protein
VRSEGDRSGQAFRAVAFVIFPAFVVIFGTIGSTKTVMNRPLIALAISVLLLLWTAAALIRTENERYALFLGMCKDFDTACLSKVETRTAWYWHLYYALLP